jgi:hypothetical protein
MNRCLWTLGLMAVTALPARGVELVRDGRPRAEIIVVGDADPSVRTAAAELQKYLKKISDAELPIVARPSGVTPVYVGASPYTDKLGIGLGDVHHDGFKIVIAERYVALVGRDACRRPIPRDNVRFGRAPKLVANWQTYTGRAWDYPYIVRDPRNYCPQFGFHFQDANGTLYAVYELLETLGMRWFMPSEELGQVIPRRRDIDLAPQTIKREPCLASRYLLLVGMGQYPAEFLWYKYLRQGSTFDQFPAHSSELVVELQQDRPELMAYAGAKRIETGRQRYHDGPRYLPRLSSPQLRDELAEYLVKFHEAFPEVPYLPIGHPDGWVAMDDRDVAAGWDKPERGNRGRYSDYVWDFVCDVAGRVRQRIPQARFLASSYGWAKFTPTILGRVPSDIAVNLCQNSTLPSFEADLALRQQWLQKAPDSEVFIYDYYLSHYPRRSLVPVPAIFTAQMQRNFRTLPERCRGIYTELSWNANRERSAVIGLPGINHLMIYLHAKFTWDKDLDVRATLDDYFEKFYGPARAEMREFFEFSEQVWMRSEPREITAASGFLKPADVPKYFDILARAKAKVGESIYAKRIDLISREIAPLKNLFSEMRRTGPYVRVFPTADVPQVDGDLAKPFWTERFAAEKVWLRDCTAGVAPDINTTSVAFRWLPDSSLLVGIVCHERRMNRLWVTTPASTKDDHRIYNDDSVELHLETPAGYRAVVVVNPSGAVRDTCLTPNVADVPDAWAAERVAVRKLSDRWTVEIKITGLGAMPNNSYPWGVNVFRQRRAGGEVEGYALSPTGTGSFINAPTKMGNLYGRAP